MNPTNTFAMTPKKWIKATNAIGIILNKVDIIMCAKGEPMS